MANTSAKLSKEDKLAAKLRENLKRRKAQTKQRAAKEKQTPPKD